MNKKNGTRLTGLVSAVSLIICAGAQAQSADITGTGNYIVPESSIEHPGDVGVRAHTNHLIANFHPDGGGFRAMTAAPYLYPALLKTAYKLPSTGGSNAIAIIDAYDYPTALNDFDIFAKQWGLPQESSANVTASTNKTFQIVYGSGSKPGGNGSWNQEEALDIEWAHAMAPNAKIYLVEAASSSYADLMTAVNTATALPNVKEVSMSFGGGESPLLYTFYDSYFLQQGVVFFASAGDSAGARSFPALSANVVAVGGTSLHLDTNGNRTSAETAWSSTGCGPSGYESRPAFQNVVSSIVGSHRGATDISAVADPATPVIVYDSTPSGGISGWLGFGGTSVASPVVAGITNLAGSFRASSQAQNQSFYNGIGTSKFTDIIAGSSGGFSTLKGYDLPTGVGSPLGLGGF